MSLPLLLASTSKYRKALLERIDVAFVCAAPDLDESAFDDRFADLDDDAFALLLAEHKARSLVAAYPDHLILAADQIATLPSPEVGASGSQRKLLHKPGTSEKATAQLMELAGKTHTLTTGLVMLDARTGRLERRVDRHRLTMIDFSEATARAYVDRYAPVDCVGAYRIEDAGITLFERVEGHDFTGIIGLPLLEVCRLLRAFGVLFR